MESPPNPGWTLESYIYHNEAMRAAEAKFQAERDRRYTEGSAADNIALKIESVARETALGLQRDYQLYRDEQANNLRDQITSERGSYVSKDEFKPVLEYIASQRGRTVGLSSTITYILGGFALLGTLVGIIGTIAAIVVIFIKGR
jgi:hypothetical protein